jgi:16S rRNA (uracil1498-N3)-methyltransferase
MSPPYFFVHDFGNATTITLPEETSKHCIQVLRMKQGEKLQLTDGKGNLLVARITNADRKHCIVSIEEKIFQQPNTKKISIAISLLKNANRFEWFLEKATEIGVTEIIPLLCERAEKQHFRFERMNNILISAMLQSQQTWLPALHEPQPFQKIVSSSTSSQKFIAHCQDENSKKNIASVAVSNEIQILIGPEGDFTKQEIEMALKNNYQPVSLGQTRLRSETAGVFAAALLINLLNPYTKKPDASLVCIKSQE